MGKIILRLILSIVSVLTVTALIKGSLIVGSIGALFVAFMYLVLEQEINTTA